MRHVQRLAYKYSTVSASIMSYSWLLSFLIPVALQSVTQTMELKAFVNLVGLNFRQWPFAIDGMGSCDP